METIGPNTRPMMMLLLLWLWVLLLGPSVYGSPLEMQLLEMMLREAEGYPINGRDQRDISVLPAASIGCDESGSQEQQFSDLFDDESEECVDFLAPYEPSFRRGLPVEHPCFVRLLLLRTPLLKEDPCGNFTLASETIRTTKKPKKKCNPKGKQKGLWPTKNFVNKKPTESTTESTNSTAALQTNSTTDSPIPETQSTPKLIKLRKLVPKNRNSTTSTTPSTISTTMEATGPDSKIINIRKYAPKNKKLKPNSTTTTSSTTLATMETTTVEETTTPEETTSTTSEDPTTNTSEQEATTPEYPTTPKTTSYTTTTQRPLTENQLKRLKAAQIRRRNRKGYGKGTPNVPDPPKIKIDGATQPSEVIHVILPTDAAEMRLQPEEDSNTTPVMTTTPMTTSTSEPETTTEDSCEDEVETTKLPEYPESEDAEASDSKGVNSMEEPCEDTEEQDTNLCPQFMPAQPNSDPPRRPQMPYRYRKPVKNYVEPILYEGNIGKPLHRNTRIGPPQKDYFISNKQIVPRPRPKYRKRLPHSIYMNNIVRGLDCVDEIDHHQSRNPNQPQRYWDLRRVGPHRRIQNIRSFAPVPARRPLPQLGSTEESAEGQHLRERESEPQPQQLLRYPEHEETVLHEEKPMPPQAMPTPSMDPCQVEHDHALFGERREHPGEYQQTSTFT
ncbi:uncharacterized protein [Drosophila kikkawai]|uniref:Mucin-5AC n=1 Tax=Drosophila kikkawai TaxID=30033 RepID=A0ABM4GFI3_DROKI